MAVHLLCGRQLPVVFAKRLRSGRRMLVVEDPAGHRLELPEAWTDLMPSVPPLCVEGRVAKFDVERLKAMAHGELGVTWLDRTSPPRSQATFRHSKTFIKTRRIDSVYNSTPSS